MGFQVHGSGGIAAALVDLCFPRVCIGCGQSSDRPDRHLCWDCLRSIDVMTDPVCRCCGDSPHGRVETAFVCGFCRAETPAFGRARSAVRFAGAAREMLHAFKYGSATWLLADLADLLEGCILAHYADIKFDAITGVPLHVRRRRSRTYNQAALLGRSLARRLKLPYIEALTRVRPTSSQTALSAVARKRNVRGAFAVRDPGVAPARRWLLVDDVMTTGATLNEASRALLAVGADWVGAATVARG